MVFLASLEAMILQRGYQYLRMRSWRFVTMWGFRFFRKGVFDFGPWGFSGCVCFGGTVMLSNFQWGGYGRQRQHTHATHNPACLYCYIFFFPACCVPACWYGRGLACLTVYTRWTYRYIYICLYTILDIFSSLPRGAYWLLHPPSVSCIFTFALIMLCLALYTWYILFT